MSPGPSLTQKLDSHPATNATFSGLPVKAAHLRHSFLFQDLYMTSAVIKRATRMVWFVNAGSVAPTLYKRLRWGSYETR